MYRRRDDIKLCINSSQLLLVVRISEEGWVAGYSMIQVYMTYILDSLL